MICDQPINEETSLCHEGNVCREIIYEFAFLLLDGKEDSISFRHMKARRS